MWVRPPPPLLILISMNYNDICNTPNHAGIYCLKNKLNGKCYIGQAIKLRSKLKSYWKTMNENPSECTDVCSEMVKHGVDNFELRVLHEIRNSLAYDTQHRLDQLEKEYTEKYNITDNE